MPVSGGVYLQRLYALPGEVMPVSAMGFDEDRCDNMMGPPCPFLDGIAFNGGVLLEWSDGGAGGAFADGNYTCPPLPGIVHLRARFDDDARAEEPGGVVVTTFDDDPVWTAPAELNVWDITSPVNPPDNFFCLPNAIPASVLIPTQASTPVWWSLWMMTDELLGFCDPQTEPDVAQVFRVTTENNRPNDPQNGRLPYSNSTFGGRPVWADVPTYESSSMKPVSFFYVKNGTNHPWAPTIPHSVDWHTGLPTPNWYYYWSQTPAGGDGNHVYHSGEENPVTWWYAGVGWQARIASWASEIKINKIVGWGDPSGIDLFAWTVRHEAQHLRDLTDPEYGWGAGPPAEPWTEGDWDGDHIPDWAEELGLWVVPWHLDDPAGFGYYLVQWDPTYDDHFNYGPGWNDCEDHALHWQEKWKNQDADSQDWSHGTYSKQWPTQ